MLSFSVVTVSFLPPPCQSFSAFPTNFVLHFLPCFPFWSFILRFDSCFNLSILPLLSHLSCNLISQFILLIHLLFSPSLFPLYLQSESWEKGLLPPGGWLNYRTISVVAIISFFCCVLAGPTKIDPVHKDSWVGKRTGCAQQSWKDDTVAYSRHYTSPLLILHFTSTVGYFPFLSYVKEHNLNVFFNNLL